MVIIFKFGVLTEFYPLLANFKSDTKTVKVFG